MVLQQTPNVFKNKLSISKLSRLNKIPDTLNVISMVAPEVWGEISLKVG